MPVCQSAQNFDSSRPESVMSFPAITPRAVPRPVPALLGFIAGFVDTCAYFGLYGIFVAQLTGSFVLASTRTVTGQQLELLTVSAIPACFLARGASHGSAGGG